MKTNPTRDIGPDALTLVEVLVIVAVIAILAFLFLRSRRDRPTYAPSLACQSNLKQVGLAFRLWAGDNNDKFPMQVPITNGGTLELVSSGNAFPHFKVMSNELNTPKVIVCPADEPRVRELKQVLAPSAGTGDWLTFSNDCPVSYFVGVDADQTRAGMLLAGDGNVTVGGSPLPHGLASLTTNNLVGWSKKMHQLCGNILLSDCSVQTVDANILHELLVKSGVATNRLAIP